MAIAKDFAIKESISESNLLRKQQLNFKFEKRIIWLLETKKNRFKTRKLLTDYLDINSRTGERWTQKYINSGISRLLSDAPKNIKLRIATPEIHAGLSKRVYSSENPFLGYWDAVQWGEKEYNVEIQYHNLRKYLIQHFKTKLKTPRKSHYRKDDKAVEAFLKTT
jgi:hypothetical protein